MPYVRLSPDNAVIIDVTLISEATSEQLRDFLINIDKWSDMFPSLIESSQLLSIGHVQLVVKVPVVNTRLFLDSRFCFIADTPGPHMSFTVKGQNATSSAFSNYIFQVTVTDCQKYGKPRTRIRCWCASPPDAIPLFPLPVLDCIIRSLKPLVKVAICKAIQDRHNMRP